MAGSVTKKISIDVIRKRKGHGKIAMLTCYDYSFAGILDTTDLDIVLVGDSLANVVLGLDQTRQVGFAEMLEHTRAVCAGIKRLLVVADMPYVSYQADPKSALRCAKEFLKAGAGAVKVEWFTDHRGNDCVSVVKDLVKHKIPVMGHIGLTPQTAHLLGGYKVQGRDCISAAKLLEQANTLERLGVFSIVLECIPFALARRITACTGVPTISCGAGKYCDGQVLVLYDMLGLYKPKHPMRFVRAYANIGEQTRQAVNRYVRDIRSLRFPSKRESFS